MRYTLAIPLALCVTAGAFAPVYTGGRRRSLFTADALPTPQESAQALTDYMAKAHEEKIRAVAAMDEKNKERIGVSLCIVIPYTVLLVCEHTNCSCLHHILCGLTKLEAKREEYLRSILSPQCRIFLCRTFQIVLVL